MRVEEIKHRLRQLRLPAFEHHCETVQQQALKEQWLPLDYLGYLSEQELERRLTGRIQRYCQEARFPPGKTLATLEMASTLASHKGNILSLANDPHWISQAENLLLFGASGLGKTHLAAAIGYGLAQKQVPVRFFTGSTLVQMLLSAKQSLTLPSYLTKLDKYRLLIIDDIGYIKQSEQEGLVLFELIAHRYETGSVLITSNQPFSAWDTVFGDSVMAVAAVDRLVHHASIIELAGESFRKKNALKSRPQTLEKEGVDMKN